MLAITRSRTKSQSCTPNILPCHIRHNGPVKVTRRYWNPTMEDDGTCTAYFRGRRLRGRRIGTPDGYRGTIVKKTGKTRLERPVLNTAAEDDEEATAEGEEEGEDGRDAQAAELREVGVLEEVGEFAEFMVWGHDAVPDELDDPYVRGVKEWVAFAEDVHCTADEPFETGS